MTDGAAPADQVPIRPAATVMLLRDTAEGPEVFLLRRTTSAVFAAGAFVFPGGRVDPADASAVLAAHCDGLDDVAASARLELPSGGLAFWVAAIRECFEEAGVLLARRADGTALRFVDRDQADAFSAHRHAIYDGTRSLAELCETERLLLDLGDVRYVSHWITPLGEPRRFDTRFFVARAPDDQVPLHDDGETVASCWIRPAHALHLHGAGQLTMLAPTLANLGYLAIHDSTESILRAAAALGRVPVHR